MITPGASSSCGTVAVIGAGGRLGATLVQAWRDHFTIHAHTRQELDVTDTEAMESALAGWLMAGVDTVVNASGITSLEVAEARPDLAWAVNARAVEHVARRCEESGLRLIHFSTDYVFDGASRHPYREEDTATPLSIYGKGKRAGEEAVLALGGEHLVFRVAWVFGPGKPAFPDTILRRAMAGEEVTAIADKWACPTSAEEVADLLRPLLRREIAAAGLFHLCQSGVCTWWDYAVEALRVAQEVGWLDRKIVPRRCLLQDMTSFTAARPIYSALDTSRFTEVTRQRPSPWPEALERYLRQHFRPEA